MSRPTTLEHTATRSRPMPIGEHARVNCKRRTPPGDKCLASHAPYRPGASADRLPRQPLRLEPPIRQRRDLRPSGAESCKSQCAAGGWRGTPTPLGVLVCWGEPRRDCVSCSHSRLEVPRQAGGYLFWGLECPMGNDVHCQCSSARWHTARRVVLRGDRRRKRQPLALARPLRRRIRG